LKRPRSHSQPQLTGSESTPWYRRSSSRLDWTTVRHPTEHVVQVLSRCSRSHGLALNRYGFAVRAPTGQICTVLPGEVRRERLVGEGEDLGVVAAADEVDQLVAGHLVREPGAAVAQDAALAVEIDQVAERDRLLEVALLLDVPALARTVAERLVLQRALAALVADGAVERVVDQQQLEDALLCPFDRVGGGVHDLAVGHRGHARHDHHRAAGTLHLDQALTAHADR
jgi:hypothetical protein